MRCVSRGCALPVPPNVPRPVRPCRADAQATAAMEILLLLIPFSVLLVLAIGAVFWWSVSNGQFDDLDGPAHRILADDDTNDVIPPASPQCDNSGRRQGGLTSVKPAPDDAR